MTHLAVFLTTTAPSSVPLDPAEYWVPVGVVVAALINIIAVIVGARIAGTRSNAALARTIAADRAARILERQVDLYAAILTFLNQRRQHRDSMLQMIKINGVENLDQYDAHDVFGLVGRAEAVADESVLIAFDETNKLDSDVIHQHLFIRAVPHSPQENMMTQYEKLEDLRKNADAADESLKVSIREALHRVDAAM